jgi:hypothetical protein
MTLTARPRCHEPDCDGVAVWDWTPPADPRSVPLCDDHAADKDLDDLEEL